MILYQITFNKVGNFALEALSENMLITFKQGVPPDLADYCFIHQHGELVGNIQVGDILEIDGIEYPITSIGNIASFNLKELGHVTWRFDGAEKAEYPGTIHVKGSPPTSIDVGTVLKIKRN